MITIGAPALFDTVSSSSNRKKRSTGSFLRALPRLLAASWPWPLADRLFQQSVAALRRFFRLRFLLLLSTLELLKAAPPRAPPASLDFCICIGGLDRAPRP